MKRQKLRMRIVLSLCCALSGGTMMANGCMNAIASLPICGGLLTFCTPADQLNLFFPLLQVPDFEADPSCTVPLGCAGNDIYGNIPPGFPGGSGGAAAGGGAGGGAGG